MKGKSKFSKEQRDKIAKEATEVGNQKSVAIKYEIDPSLVYSWVQSYRNRAFSEKNKSTKAYERELEDLKLENKILKELLKKTTQTLIKD